MPIATIIGVMTGPLVPAAFHNVFMSQLFALAAITDEFAADFETTLQSMADLGMSGAELRVLFEKNIIDLTDEELNQARAMASSKGLRIVSIASPLLKCVLPDAPELDLRFQQDIFASKHTFEDQPQLARRAFEIAHRMGVRLIRVFSYWRTVQPEKCFDRIVEALDKLARQAAREDLIIGLENEHACNIATAAEAARVLKKLNHANLKMVWDPANAYVSGEVPYPDGYRLLPVERIVHVHAKDCHVQDHSPIWGPIGEGGIDWRGQIAALARDGYQGYISLETHWAGPSGNKFEASIICARNLRNLVAA